MTRVIALTQFLFLAIGTMALLILMKTHNEHAGWAHECRRVVTSYHALWLVLVPILWAVFAEVCLHFSPRDATLKAVQASGSLLAGAILVFYGWLVLSF